MVITNEILDQLAKNDSSEMELNLLQNKDKINISDNLSNILNNNNVNNKQKTESNVESDTSSNSTVSFNNAPELNNNINVLNRSSSEQERDSDTKIDKKKEKMQLLFKLFFLKKKGYPIDPNITNTSSYEEILFEYEKIKTMTDKEEGIKSYRHLLIMSITFLEYLNGKFNPFEIHLEGWSENVYEDINNYDSVFEELLDKYKTKTKMAPEVRLIMMLAGSALMYHLMGSTAKNLKSSAANGNGGNGGLGNLFGSIIGNFGNMAQGVSGVQEASKQTNSQSQSQSFNNTQNKQSQKNSNSVQNNNTMDSLKLEQILSNLNDSLKSDTNSISYNESDIYETETSKTKRK
jgi:hypothetical protein